MKVTCLLVTTLRQGFDQHEAGDLWVNGFLNRSCLFCCGVEDQRLALIHITQNSIQQDLEHLPSGANAIPRFNWSINETWRLGSLSVMDFDVDSSPVKRSTLLPEGYRP